MIMLMMDMITRMAMKVTTTNNAAGLPNELKTALEDLRGRVSIEARYIA
jgi:hypothetical protein